MAKQSTEKRTHRGQIIKIRKFHYHPENHPDPDFKDFAFELVLSVPGFPRAKFITLFGDARSWANGWWLDPQDWNKRVAGDRLVVGDWVMGHGNYHEKPFDSDNWGKIIQPKVAVYNTTAVQRIAPPKEMPDTIAPEPKGSKRPSAV